MIKTEWATECPSGVPESVAAATEMMQSAYPDTRTLLALRRQVVAAVWVLPIDIDSAGTHVGRSSRVLPYAAPALLDEHPQRRRDVMSRLLGAIRETCVSLDLPMSPDFRDVTVCRELGMAVEWRHTHVLNLGSPWRAGYSATARQHLRTARAAVAVHPDKVDRFCFDRALLGQTTEQVALRERFARQAAGRGAVTCLTAMAGGKAVGQNLVLHEADMSLLLHSWFCRGGPRGVPTLLVDAAAEISCRHGVERFDLEGSVLPGVDYFMSGFGGETVPYPYVYWHRDVDALTALLMREIAIGAKPAGNL